MYATGYGSMNGFVAQIVSREVADKVGKCWGLGSGTTGDPGPWEGELRNMWKPTQQPGLWFHGGNLHQSRHYSLLLALQLKARWKASIHLSTGLPMCTIRHRGTRWPLTLATPLQRAESVTRGAVRAAYTRGFRPMLLGTCSSRPSGSPSRPPNAARKITVFRSPPVAPGHRGLQTDEEGKRRSQALRA